MSFLDMLLALCVGAAILTTGAIVLSGRRRRELLAEEQPVADTHIPTMLNLDSKFITDLDETQWVGGNWTPTGKAPSEKAVELLHDTEAWDQPTQQNALVATGVRRLKKLPPVVDDLGQWEPWLHDQEQPLLLGEVLAGRKWRTVRPSDVGMGS